MFDIPGNFLNKEVRDGFMVPALMKATWAAEMKTLDAIITLCKEHQLTYYAAFGTMLGAVRHKGFVPWDDDMDIAMPREDYMKFLPLSAELPEPYRVKSIYTQDVFTQFHAVVSNSREEKLTWDEERINAFYGCPFVVGIDIYPLDCVPKEQGRQDIQRLVYTLGFGLTGQMEQIFSKPYTVTLSEIDENPEAVLKGEISVETIKDLENFIKGLLTFGKYLNTSFDRESSLFMQLMILTDQIAANCKREDAGYMDFFHHLAEMGANYTHFFRKVEWYDSTVELPFENMMLTVPSGYKEILSVQYGDWHREIKGGSRHGYPFYQSQEEYFKFLGKM